MSGSLNNPELHELRILVLQSIDGLISRDGALRMEEILESSVSAREYYAEYLSTYCDVASISEGIDLEADYGSESHNQLSDLLDSLFRPERDFSEELFEANGTDARNHSGQYKYSSIFRKKVAWSIAASIAAIFVIVVSLKMIRPVSTNYVGQLTKIVDADWVDIRGDIGVGSNFYPGPMKLDKGLAEITFKSGAVAIIEGPCEFNLENESQLSLHSGSIVVDIASSAEKGFVVRTHNTTIIDYGTEFGVNVDKNGNTKAYVFKGSVEMRQGNDPLRYGNTLWLDAGKGGRSDNEGNLYKEDIDTKIFIRKEQMESYVLAAKGSGYHRWKAYNYQLHRDPSLIAHYTFEKKTGFEDRLLNTSAYDDIPDGILDSDHFDSPQWTVGRWPQKTALRFDDKENDAVLIPASESLSITGSITITAWFKSEKDSGEVRGHIISSRTGSAVNYSIYLGKARGGQKGDTPKVQVLFTRRWSGEEHVEGYEYGEGLTVDTQNWHLVCVAHDNKTVRFYLDGELVAVQDYGYEPKSILSDVVIGNSYSGSWVRKYHGLIGEIAIFDRVLDSSEIEDMYLAGKE